MKFGAHMQIACLALSKVHLTFNIVEATHINGRARLVTKTVDLCIAPMVHSPERPLNRWTRIYVYARPPVRGGRDMNRQLAC